MRLLLVLLAAVVLPPATAAAPALAVNPPPPAATTGAASDVTQTSATLHATVNPNGAETTWHFEYGTSDAYGLTTPDRSAGAGDAAAPVELAVEQLTADTTYHARIVATNAAGTSRGADITFRTAAVPRAPRVSSLSAGAITANGATLRASLDPRGQATTYHFEWGRTKGYGQRTADVVVSGTGSRTVTAPVAGLAPYTTYHFRLVASNATGTTRGSDRSLRTLRAPTAITVSPVTRLVGWGARVRLTGRVEGGGVSRTSVAVQRTDFPYTRPTWVTRTFTTGTDGRFTVDVGPLWQTTRLQLVTRTATVARSPVLEIGTRALIGVRRAGGDARSVTLTGIVRPAAPQARVSVQRRTRSGRWAPVARGGVTAFRGGRSRYVLRVPRARRVSEVRAVVLPGDAGAHARGVSRTLRIAGRR